MEFMCLDFVNSGWYRNHERFVELLEDPEWLNIFCTKWHIPIPEHVPTTISALHDCRETLYQIVIQLCKTQSMSSQHLQMVNHYLDLECSQKHLGYQNGHLALNITPKTSSLHWMLYKLAESLTDLTIHYDLKNLKLCENPDCDWVFYDTSKNHSRKWCGDKCASLIKVRKHRAKKRM